MLLSDYIGQGVAANSRVGSFLAARARRRAGCGCRSPARSLPGTDRPGLAAFQDTPRSAVRVTAGPWVDREHRRQSSWRAHAHALQRARLSRLDRYRRFGDAELFGKPRCEVRVGPAIDRGRGDPYAQAAGLWLGEGVLARLGLQLEIQQQIVSIPAVPVRRFQSSWPIKSFNGGISSISSTTRPSITTMGDRSSPPMSGIRRLTGASNGSVRLWIRETTGL